LNRHRGLANKGRKGILQKREDIFSVEDEKRRERKQGKRSGKKKRANVLERAEEKRKLSRAGSPERPRPA